MSGTAAIIVKIMPDSPDADLELIKASVIKFIESEGGQNITITEDPIAFGLKALMIKFAWPEEKDTDLIDNALSSIEHVTSASIEDYRRAFG